MAHDRQLTPEDLVERKKDSPTRSAKASASLALLADWWSIYGQIYRDDPSELLAVAFRETLQGLPEKVLHESCLKAQRECPQFRPTPGRIYEIARAILERNQPSNRPAYLDEPPTSQAEREAALEETKEAREELRRKLGLHVVKTDA